MSPVSYRAESQMDRALPLSHCPQGCAPLPLPPCMGLSLAALQGLLEVLSVLPVWSLPCKALCQQAAGQQGTAG